MTDAETTAEYKLRWDAAIRAVPRWHEAQTSKALVQAERNRFPKNLEREAEFRNPSAELVGTLSPDYV